MCIWQRWAVCGNKSRKAQIRKFVRFTDFPQMWYLVDLRFADTIFFVICAIVICGYAIFRPKLLLQT